MTPAIEFNPAAYSEPALRLIMVRAQEWQCTPAEAVARLLDRLADKGGFKPKAPLSPPAS